MYYCNDCGEFFSDFKYVGEDRPYGEGWATEYFGVCPCCESDDCVEAEVCTCCEEAFKEDDIIDGMCEECFNNYRNRLADAIYKEFSKADYQIMPESIFDDIWEILDKKYSDDHNT